MRTGAGNHKLQKSQSLFESSNFCLATSLPVLVGRWLGNALVLNLLEKLGNCGKLDLNNLLAGIEFSVGLVQASVKYKWPNQWHRFANGVPRS